MTRTAPALRAMAAAVGASAAAAAPAPASPEALLELFAANFATLDVAAQAALFAPDAAFFGSAVPGPLHGPEGWRFAGLHVSAPPQR